MKQWILIRHGESSANANGILSGWLDVPLTDHGKHQAIEVGKSLSKWPVEAVWSSDLKRACRTAHLALTEHKLLTGRSFTIQSSPSFRERCFGSLQGESKVKLQKDGRLSLLKHWQPETDSIEGFEDLARRLLPQMDRSTQYPCQVLFSHGGVIRLLLGLIEGKNKTDIATYHIENATPIVVTSPPSGWTSLLPELF